MSALTTFEQQQLWYDLDEKASRWLQDNATATDSGGIKSRSAVDIFSAVTSNVLLFFLIYGLSATVQLKNLRKQLGNKFALGTGILMQFAIMPLLGFISVVSLSDHGLTQAMGIALLVVTASPGGSFSNWWCSMFNADLALSVAMTSVSSLLSVVLLPANLFLYSYLAFGSEEDKSILEVLDFRTIFISLGIVMGAIVLGLYSGYRWDSDWFHSTANRVGSVCGLLLILFSIFLSTGTDTGDSTNEDPNHFFAHPWSFYVGVSAPCLLGILLANIISQSFQISKPECVAISIECCYQNTGIATSVAVTMFEGAERAQAVAVPLLYGIVEAVVIGVYCVWAWKVGWTKAPANEHICTVIGKTYELEEEDKSQTDPGQGGDEEATGDIIHSEDDLDSRDVVEKAKPDPEANESGGSAGIPGEDHQGESSCAIDTRIVEIPSADTDTASNGSFFDVVIFHESMRQPSEGEPQPGRLPRTSSW